MKLKSFKNLLVLSLTLLSGLSLASCGSGGLDRPFIFPPGDGEQVGEISQPPPPPECTLNTDCPSGEECQEGSCVPITVPSCQSDGECGSGRICKEGSCVTGCRDNSGCPTDQLCNTEINLCQVPLPADTCDVTFETTLELRADSKLDSTDIPSFCNAIDTNFDHSDLVCCTDQNFDNPGTEPNFGNNLVCDQVGRFATTQFRGSKPLKIRFDLSDGGCRVLIAATDVPEYSLENSVLESSLRIDGGGNPFAPDELENWVAQGTCQETGDGIAIQINNPGLNFMLRFYENWTRCQRAVNQTDRERCEIQSSFSEWFNTAGVPITEPPPSFASVFQMLPGLANTPFELSTGTQTASPRPGVVGVASISATGAPLKTETDGTTKMTLVTAFRLAEEDQNVNFQTGTGSLTGPLADAVMTATITGRATNLTNPTATIRTLADLSQNCGGETTGDFSLSASIKFPADGGSPITENLAVTGSVEEGFVIDACLPGTHEDGNCLFLPSEDLPFAKEEGDPFFPSTADRFEGRGVITLTIEPGSDSNLDLDIPVGTGTAFEIENADLLNDLVIAPVVGSSVDLEILFSPKAAGAGCLTSNGSVACSTQGVGGIVLSQSPRITLALKGAARVPGAVLKLDQLRLESPDQVLTPLLPSSTGAANLAFSEQVLGVGTEHRLLRISNEGVRSFQVSRLDVLDPNHNFRLGSIGQGANFTERVWKSDLPSWTIPPTGEQDLFFFLNYGPFVRPRLTSGSTTRQDLASLLINTLGNPSTLIPLEGTAKLDRRASLALYLQDETRFATEGGCLGECLEIVPGEHLYPAHNLLLSFRQDGTPNRAVYIRNNTALGEDLKIRSRPEPFFQNPQSAAKFPITYETLPDPFEVTLKPSESLRLGTITFSASSGGGYQVFQGSLPIDAVSVATSGGAESRPKIAGGEPTGSPAIPTFLLKGANGAPSGLKTLVIHRLLSGMDTVISTSNQKSLIASTTTRGILERYETQQGITLPATDFTKYLETFRIPGGIELDPIQGIAKLKPIFTPLDPTPNSPLSTQDGSFEGLRLFNAPGSNPARQEYRIQCEKTTASTRNCAYFYLYVADAQVLDQIPSCGGGKAAIASAPATSLSNILNPEGATEATCLRDFIHSLPPITGRFDPVTGELSFKDVAIRLFAPNVPALGTDDADSTIRVALTTECLTEEFVPDEATLSKRLVPQATLDDRCPGGTICFDQELMGGANPIGFYAGDGQSCAERELHGRRLVLQNASTGTTENTDTTGTFDVGSGPSPGALNFDLAGVGQIKSSSNLANKITLYLVMKAEVQ